MKGKVSIVAPDVLMSTYYGISVNKSGYKSRSEMIKIYNDNRGLLLMDVIYPYIVQSGEKDVKITIIGSNGGIENVNLELYYEDEIYCSYKSDENGNIYIDAPKINNDNYFTITVGKNGYNTYYSIQQFEISLFITDFNSDLYINVDPSELYEGEYVTIEVTDDIGLGVNGVSIWRGSELLKERTDSNGYLNFPAPSVFLDREYYIYAIKEGFNYASESITVRDKIEPKQNLIISSVNSINESDSFDVTIKDNDNIVLSDVLVTFNSEQKITNAHGIVDFIAPNITSSSFFKIEAVKYGYQPASLSIEVKKTQSQNSTNDSEMIICVEPYILENNNFIVTIRNYQGYAISDVSVKFKETILKTDSKGEALFFAPDVNWDEIYKISATKTGFNSASTDIIIKNINGFQYWYLVIIIIIILIVGILTYLRYRQIF